jgi:hypothetical protein
MQGPDSVFLHDDHPSIRPRCNIAALKQALDAHRDQLVRLRRSVWIDALPDYQGDFSNYTILEELEVPHSYLLNGKTSSIAKRLPGPLRVLQARGTSYFNRGGCL